MASIATLKQATFGSISALQTVLERYPVLVTTDANLGKTSFSFTLNLLKIFGVSEQDIIEWLSKILADKKDGSNGLLTTIEWAIKTIILISFKDSYTCYINPSLPDDLMLDIYDWVPRGNGIDIKIDDIDTGGKLSYCPTDKNEGKIDRFFYFDNSGYTPSNIYSSEDFDAFLWYVINKGNFWGSVEERRKCMWDNRFYYYKKWEKEGCLNGESATDTSTSKGKFFNTPCQDMTITFAEGVGPKFEILCAEFKESQTEGNLLNIHLNSNRYYRGTIGNKTIFDFNTDYLTNIKLFSTKTLLSNILNSLLNISTSSFNLNMSVERNVLSKQIKSMVKKIMEEESEPSVETTNDCYFTFSNDEYNRMMEEAVEAYGKEEKSRTTEENDIDILNSLYKIETAENLQTEENEINNAITNALKYYSENNSQKSQPTTLNFEGTVDYNGSVITDFLTELVTQLILQIFSPKVMLLYAINEKIMEPTENVKSLSFSDFIKKHINLVVGITRKILDYIMQYLMEFLLEHIKPLITLFIEKLLLETIYYYKILIEQIIESCSINNNFNTNRDPLSIDNVIGADIIPTQEAPTPEDGCRGM